MAKTEVIPRRAWSRIPQACAPEGLSLLHKFGQRNFDPDKNYFVAMQANHPGTELWPAATPHLRFPTKSPEQMDEWVAAYFARSAEEKAQRATANAVRLKCAPRPRTRLATRLPQRPGAQPQPLPPRHAAAPPSTRAHAAASTRAHAPASARGCPQPLPQPVPTPSICRRPCLSPLVRVTGLRSEALNGADGVRGAWDDARGRWAVQLRAGGR